MYVDFVTELNVLNAHIERAAVGNAVVGQRMCAAVLMNLLVDLGYDPQFTEYDGAAALSLTGRSDVAVVIAPCHTWEHDDFDEVGPAAWEATVVDRITGNQVPMPVPESDRPYVCPTIWAREEIGADMHAGLRFVAEVLALAHSILAFRPARFDPDVVDGRLHAS